MCHCTLGHLNFSWPEMSPLNLRASYISLSVTGLFAVFSAAMIIVASIPKLAELTRLDRLADLYSVVVRKPLFKLVFGTDIEPPWSGIAFDAAALWLSLFVVINVFVYRHEGVFLWGHIRRNYCSRAADTWSHAGVCTLTRWFVALAATPIACLGTFVASIRSDHTLFTSCFITLDPSEIAKYLKLLGLALVALFAIGTLVFRLASP